jgi:hypothetical protein
MGAQPLKRVSGGAQLNVFSAADGFSTRLDSPFFLFLPRSVITFFQQVGFASLESGSVRAKNTRNVLLKVRKGREERVVLPF